MSFTATLKIGGKDFSILHAEYDFTQPTNAQRQPVARPVSGFINLTIEASKDSEPIEWMLNHQMVKSGAIIFYRTDSLSEMRKIEFENAYCVYYKEVFDTYSDRPMLIQLKLSPQKMSISGQTVYTEWTISESETGPASDSQSSGNSGVSSFIAD